MGVFHLFNLFLCDISVYTHVHEYCPKQGNSHGYWQVFYVRRMAAYVKVMENRRE